MEYTKGEWKATNIEENANGVTIVRVGCLSEPQAGARLDQHIAYVFNLGDYTLTPRNHTITNLRSGVPC